MQTFTPERHVRAVRAAHEIGARITGRVAAGVDGSDAGEGQFVGDAGVLEAFESCRGEKTRDLL